MATPKRSKELRELAKAKGLCQVCQEKLFTPGKTTCNDCRRRMKNRGIAIRQAVFEAYGGIFCNCCGESNEFFLTIDHINNDGADHRRKIGNGDAQKGGKHIYAWLKKNNFPPGFQVLCMNCNFGKRNNGGVCPHKQGTHE